MNRKKVARIFVRKHKDFLTSIEDENVKKLISENSIITGGAIASLLLNQKVNDFDYYFTDEATCKAVAEYYVSQFIKNNPECKIKPKVKIEDHRVKVHVQSAGAASEAGDDPYKYFEAEPQDDAGGFVDEITSVLDEGDDIPAEEMENLGDKSKKYRPVFMTSNAITLANKVQLIIRFYGNPEEIHKNYDFVHCTNYWTSKDKELVLHPDALESLLSRHLFYVGSLYPICSVIRTRKFLKTGWHINAGQYIKMLFQVSELDLTNIETLEDQLTGVDNAYFYQIIDWFRKKIEEDENFKIDGTYLASIIDKIF